MLNGMLIVKVPRSIIYTVKHLLMWEGSGCNKLQTKGSEGSPQCLPHMSNSENEMSAGKLESFLGQKQWKQWVWCCGKCARDGVSWWGRVQPVTWLQWYCSQQQVEFHLLHHIISWFGKILWILCKNPPDNCGNFKVPYLFLKRRSFATLVEVPRYAILKFQMETVSYLRRKDSWESEKLVSRYKCVSAWLKLKSLRSVISFKFSKLLSVYDVAKLVYFTWKLNKWMELWRLKHFQVNRVLVQ